MKKILILWLAVICGGNVLFAQQNCDLRSMVGGNYNTSVLGLALGNYPHFDEAGREYALKQVEQQFAEEHQRLLATTVLTGVNRAVYDEGTAAKYEAGADSSQLATRNYYQGIHRTLAGQYSEAVAHFNIAEFSGGVESDCRLNQFRLVAQYLAKFGDEVPLFPGFNNGFYNFASDSLNFPVNNPDSLIYHQLMRSVMDLYILDPSHQPVYLEMLGDLVSQYPSRITANWLGSILYYRLGYLLPDHRDAYFEKAIYALESPSMARTRFDQYQFNRLGIRIEEDLETAEKARKAYAKAEEEAIAAGKSPGEVLTSTYGAMDKEFVWIRREEPGVLPGVIVEVDRREAVRRGEDLTFAGQVDLKKVKSDTKFNFYAIILIATVIGAIVFFWMQIRRNSKDGEGKGQNG